MKIGVYKVVREVKALAAKPGALSSVPWTHMVEGEN